MRSSLQAKNQNEAVLLEPRKWGDVAGVVGASCTQPCKTCWEWRLVSQRLRICLPLQGTWIRSLVWEDSCLGSNPACQSVQSLSRVRLSVTPRTAACQASLPITNSQSLLKRMYIESVMPSNLYTTTRPAHHAYWAHALEPKNRNHCTPQA